MIRQEMDTKQMEGDNKRETQERWLGSGLPKALKNAPNLVAGGLMATTGLLPMAGKTEANKSVDEGRVAGPNPVVEQSNPGGGEKLRQKEAEIKVNEIPSANLEKSELDSVDQSGGVMTLEVGSVLSGLVDKLQPLMIEGEMSMQVAFVTGKDGVTTGVPFLRVDKEGGSGLKQGSIVYSVGDRIGHMEPVEVEGYGLTTPVLMVMTEDLHKYLVGDGEESFGLITADGGKLEVPEVGKWVAVTTWSDGEEMIPVSLDAVKVKNGEPIAIVISSAMAGEKEAPATPTPPRNGEVRLVSAEVGNPQEDSMDMWVSGEYEFTDEDRLVGPFGEPYRLGYVGDEIKDPNKERLTQFVGELLEVEVVGGRLIGYVGFEDVSGTKFFIPFDFGRIDDQIVKRGWMEYPGKELLPSGSLQGQPMVPGELVEKLEQSEGKIMKVDVMVGLVGATRPDDPERAEYFDAVVAEVGPFFEESQKINGFIFEMIAGRFDPSTAPGEVNRKYDPDGLIVPAAVGVSIATGQ